jgi:hypothetical protein
MGATSAMKILFDEFKKVITKDSKCKSYYLSIESMMKPEYLFLNIFMKEKFLRNSTNNSELVHSSYNNR